MIELIMLIMVVAIGWCVQSIQSTLERIERILALQNTILEDEEHTVECQHTDDKPRKAGARPYQHTD